MGQELQRLKRRKKARETVEKLDKEGNSGLIIHYSCESFYDKTDGKSPRVTSIAIRNVASGQTVSFSIHLIAEREHIALNDIELYYDSLEKKMLTEFYEFANTHQHFSWIHWNMRDANYGFAAIEHRFRVLGGTPVIITEERKYDLALLLVYLYGQEYIPHPKLTNLLQKNNMSHKDFLPGSEEATAFVGKEYLKLHQSTLRKVNLIGHILEKAADGKLKTNATWLDQHGFHPVAIVEFIREHWIWSLIGIILTITTIILRILDVF
jgi:hypothetical protein